MAAERGRLVDAARAGALDRRDLAGGTCTLSNLGAYPVDFFAPVVSGPQVAIGRDRPHHGQAGRGRRRSLGVRPRLWVNVAIDHRAADGEAGGRLLAALERRLTPCYSQEAPMTIAPVPVDEAVPGPRPELDDDGLLAHLAEMVRIRRFEEEVVDAFADGLIPGSTHPCIGRRRSRPARSSALAPDDHVFATYRGHGEALARASSLSR